MDFKRILLSSTLAIAAAFGCSDDADSDGSVDAEEFEVSVETGPLFSWDGGPVGVLIVSSCKNQEIGDTCDLENRCAGSTVWAIDQTAANGISSPVEYGVFAGQPDPSALMLEANVRHTIALERYEACSSGENGCFELTAFGCTVFTP